MKNLSFNIYNLIILCGCVQGLLLSFSLYKVKSFKKRSNSNLALMILCFSLGNFRQFCIDADASRQHPVFWFLPLTFGFLIPVGFYLYVQYQINPDHRPGRSRYWLLVPFIIHFTFQVAVFVTFIVKPYILFQHGRWLRNISVGAEMASMVYCMTILYFILRDIAKYERRLKDHFSSVHNKTLRWLQKLIVTLSALWALWSIPYLFEVLTNRFLQWHHYPLWIGMSAIMYWIGYSAYYRTEIFHTPIIPVEEDTKTPIKPSDKSAVHHARLIECMKTKRPYLNPELSLQELAGEIDLSAGYLSQIINKTEHVNFYDFVNRYRVDEAKQRLSNPQFDHYSILAIGLDSGFNSKATFNSAFKKYSGLTPSSFKTQQRSEAKIA